MRARVGPEPVERQRLARQVPAAGPHRGRAPPAAPGEARGRADAGRQRRRSSARPQSIPACGPPRSLSPLEVDEVGAVGEELGDARMAGGRSAARAATPAAQEPLALVDDERQPAPRASAASSAISTDSTKPLIR